MPPTLHLAAGSTVGPAISSAIGSAVGSAVGAAVGALVDPPTVVAALLLGLLSLVAGAAAVVIGVARRRAARRDTAGGVWWQITPPGRTNPGSAVALWQLLGGLLRRHPGPWWWPTRLVLESVATADGTRIGLWLPPALAAAAPDQTLTAVLPGVRITPAAAPVWPATGVSVVELVPRGGIWAPVLDPTVPTLLAQATRTHDSNQAGSGSRCGCCTRCWPPAPPAIRPSSRSWCAPTTAPATARPAPDRRRRGAVSGTGCSTGSPAPCCCSRTVSRCW